MTTYHYFLYHKEVGRRTYAEAVIGNRKVFLAGFGKLPPVRDVRSNLMQLIKDRAKAGDEQQVWVVSGKGSSPVKYSLTACFIIDDLDSLKPVDKRYRVAGKRGTLFKTPIPISPSTHKWAVDLLSLPQQSRGFRPLGDNVSD